MLIPSIGSTQLVASPRLRAHAPQSEDLMRFQASQPVSAGERTPHFITSPLSGRVLECWNVVRVWRTVPYASARSVTFNRGILSSVSPGGFLPNPCGTLADEFVGFLAAYHVGCTRSVVMRCRVVVGHKRRYKS